MKKVLASIALLVFSLLLGAAPAISRGDTLTVGITLDGKTLDPQATTQGTTFGVCWHVSETLVTVKDGKIAPLLATSWKMLDDKQTYEFTLKDKVTFHNGELMTADDVVYSFQRAMSPAGATTRGWSMYLADVGKKDEKTVYLKAKSPMGQTFIGMLSHPWASVYNKKYTEAVGKDYGQKPVGTGKFKFKNMVLGDRVELERFDGYHGEKAKVKNLIFRTIVEPSGRTIELESGAIDVATEVAPVDAGRLKDNPKLEFVEVPSYRLHHIGIDVTSPPYDNLKVRQAMSLAINRPGIVKTVFRGFAAPARGPIPPTIDYSQHDQSPELPYDPALAKKLLAEAGYPNGFKGKMMTGERYDYQKGATVAQSNLRDIGIDLELRIFDTATLVEYMRQPKHEPYGTNNWGGNVPTSDPFFYLNALYHSSNIGNTNRSYYKNPELDTLLDRGVAEVDPAKRNEYYAKAWSILNRDLPLIPLTYAINIYARAKNLKGVSFAPTAMNWYGDAYFE